MLVFEWVGFFFFLLIKKKENRVRRFSFEDIGEGEIGFNQSLWSFFTFVFSWLQILAKFHTVSDSDLEDRFGTPDPVDVITNKPFLAIIQKDGLSLFVAKVQEPKNE